MTAAIGVLALATVLNGGAGGAPPNIREQVGRIRALSASPATLGTAAAAALALQLRYPGNPEIRELLEDVTARRHLCIAALRLLRERLKERRDLRVLDDVTRAHLAHLRAVDATAGGAHAALRCSRCRLTAASCRGRARPAPWI